MNAKTRNASAMKAGNMLEIIGIVRRKSVSRADLARMTGLTRAAVTIIVDRLEKAGILRDKENQSGKKKVLLELIGGSFYFMGVDITRTGCTVGIVDFTGKALKSTRFALNPDDSFDSVLPKIRAAMGKAQTWLENPEKLMGVGVSAPGPVNALDGIVLNPPNFQMLRGQPVLQKLAGAAGCGMWLDNNAAARALYEKHLGAGARFRNFMVLTVDTGIGSGLVLDGKLYRGAGFAGEAGHVSVDIRGERCACGNRGCLELYASIPNLLRRQCGSRPDISTWKNVVDGAASGDAHCLAVLEKQAAYLSQCIVNTANLLDLEAVILTGFINYRPELLLGMVNRAAGASRITGDIHPMRILASRPREAAGMAGAAAIAMEQFLSGNIAWNLEG